MKKLGLLFREQAESRIKNHLNESESFFILTYSKLSSPELCTLRQSLKGSNSRLFVVKNSIARRVLKSPELADLVKFIDGPCGFVFTKEEPVDVSRILWNFSKEHEQFVLRAGFLDNKILERKDIETLAKLPARPVLRFQAVVALKSPITGTVFVLKQALNKFVYCLQEIKKKRGN